MWRTVAGEKAALAHIAVFLAFWSRSGSHVTADRLPGIFGEKFTIFKISRCPAKDKIDISFDIASLVEMPSIDPWCRLLWSYKSIRLDLFWRQRRCEQGILVS